MNKLVSVRTIEGADEKEGGFEDDFDTEKGHIP